MKPDAGLRELQQWMQGVLIDPGASSAADIAAAIFPGPRMPASACLAVYQRSYILRLRKCLEEQFPASRHALGEQLFADFADEYLRDCPPDSHTLYDLGRRLAQWLEDNRPDRGETLAQRESWIDFMVDLAGYEYELYRLFDAPGHEGGAWPDVKAEDGSLILQPALSLAAYRFPVAWYYHEVRAGRAPVFPAAEPSHIVMLRRDFLTHTYPVTPQHYRFLVLVQQLRHLPRALREIAAENGRSLAEVEISWCDDVRAAWLEAGFFVERSAQEI